LDHDTIYYYNVGDKAGGFSSTLQFKTIPDKHHVIDMIVYGDFGFTNPQSLKNLIQEAQNYSTDLILHVGDWAYDLFTSNGTVGDKFLNLIQPISSRIPYMGCLGNHEMKYNGTHYTQRFRIFNYAGQASGSGNNWFFSWDYHSGDALVHMVAITSEVYYIYVDNEKPPNLLPQMKAQYSWLQEDLADARDRGADWIIVYGHRPMYCSDVDDFPDCSTDAETLRLGLNGTICPMEVILQQFGVDLYICAHEHSYERTFPVYDGIIDYQSNHTYINPKYPIHLINGAAGNQEDLDSFDEVFYGPWSAVRSASYGYGHLKVYNSTHMYYEQLIQEDPNNLDTLWVIKGQ